MTIGNVLTIIGLCFTVFFSGFALYYSTKNNKRTDTKDIEQQVKEKAEIKVSLEMINKNTLDIKNDMSSVKDDIKSHHDRIIVLEQSFKSLHHRVDDFNDRLNAIEKED